MCVVTSFRIQVVGVLTLVLATSCSYANDTTSQASVSPTPGSSAARIAKLNMRAHLASEYDTYGKEFSVTSDGAVLKVPTAFRAPVFTYRNTKDCGKTPSPYLGTLEFRSRYEGSDSARDELNEEAEEAYQDMTESIKEMEQRSAELADEYLKGDIGARNCLGQELLSWAKANALMSESVNNMGQSVRKWALATFANTYLKITQPSTAPALDETNRQSIELWMKTLALEVRAYYADRPLTKVNNHDYWAAWAVAQVAVITDDKSLFEWSMGKLAQAISQIDENGYLPNELRRETRALYYHNYALQPLSWLIVFADTNGYALSSTQLAKVNKLAHNTVAGLINPELFKKLTGQEQYITGLYTSYNLAWMEVWGSHFALVDGMSKYLKDYRPMQATRMGGDVSMFFSKVAGRATTPLLVK